MTSLLCILHSGGEEIAGRIGKAHRIDDRHGRTVHLRAVNPKLLGKLTRLAPIEEHRTRIGLQIEQPAGSRNALGERHPPRRGLGASTELELTLLAGGSKRQEGLRLLVEIDGVARPRPDVVARLIDQRAKRHRARRPWRSKHHPSVLALILQAAGPGDHVEQVLARRLRWNAARGECECTLFTSPMTVMSEVFCVTSATTTCGSIARFLIRSTISCWTSDGVLPAAGTRPA